jgi:asparagine synthase (glutamine-hydrolysing)
MVWPALDDHPEISRDYLLDSLVNVKTAKSNTPYTTISRLAPAHFLEYKSGDVKLTRYWKPDIRATIDLNREEDYIDMFRELLIQAVNMRCTGLSGVAAELSGGLDSSAITGMAADFAAREHIPFTAFSNVFPQDTGVDFKDEREFIEEMLAFKQVKGVKIDHLDKKITDLLQHTLDIQGTFVQQNFNLLNYGLLKAAGNSGSAVLLSGFGGDELVSARTAFTWNELIIKRKWNALRDELFYGRGTIRALLKSGLISAKYLYSRLYKPDFLTGPFTTELLEKRLHNLPLQTDFSTQNRLLERMEKKFRFPNEDQLSVRQLFRVDMDHLPQRMEYCYTAAAQFGLEYRYPLLDVNLVLACLAFPPWVKHHHGINRYIFRQAVSGFVPEVIRQRNDKSGTTIPHAYASLVRDRESISALIRDCKDIPALQEIFDFSRFPAWYEKLVARNADDMNYLNPGAFYTCLMILLYYKNRQ